MERNIVKPKTQKGFKNDRGDYVVTTIDIHDLRTGVNDKKEKNIENDDESSSDEGYGDEDDKAEATAPAEVIAPKQSGKSNFNFCYHFVCVEKKLSKKE